MQFPAPLEHNDDVELLKGHTGYFYMSDSRRNKLFHGGWVS